MLDHLHRDPVSPESKLRSVIRALALAALVPLPGCILSVPEEYTLRACVRTEFTRTTAAVCSSAPHRIFADGTCYTYLDNSTIPDAAVNISTDPVACAQAGGQLAIFRGNYVTRERTLLSIGNDGGARLDASSD